MIIDEDKDESDQSQDERLDDAVDTALRKDRPSAEALAKIKDYRMCTWNQSQHSSVSLISTAVIPYLDDEQAIAATKNPQLKLLFRLCKFAILDKGIGQCSNRKNGELIVFCSGRWGWVAVVHPCCYPPFRTSGDAECNKWISENAIQPWWKEGNFLIE